MRPFIPEPFALAPRVTKFRAADHLLSLICVVRAALVPGGVCTLLPKKQQPGLRHSALHADEIGASPAYGGDLAPFKPRTDLTVDAVAHVPGGGSASLLHVALGVGDWRKTLDVTGDRTWQRGSKIELSQPASFAEMPIRLEKAFGGPASRFNPWGKGYGMLKEEPGSQLPAANIHPTGEHQLRWDAPVPPAGFGPLSPHTHPRLGLRGRHEGGWAAQGGLPPKDFDWGFYNVAPPDQQFHPYLKGNETLFFENLHPSLPRFASELPGLRPRMLVRKTDDQDAEAVFEELHPVLDSIHVDTQAMTVDLGWRAVMSVPDADASAITHCLLSVERLSEAPRPLADLVAEFKARLAPRRLAIPPLPSPPPPDPEADRKLADSLRETLQSLPLPPDLAAAIQAETSGRRIKALLDDALAKLAAQQKAASQPTIEG
ncbi:DUF2169 family type VI secretion system accessory protein [Acidisoma sp. C75]